jgi:plasmid stability protein
MNMMASIIVRRLDEATKTRLRVRAARHGRSMEEEAREILKAAVAQDRERSRNLAEAIRARFAPLGGVNLPPLRREPLREPPKLDR